MIASFRLNNKKRWSWLNCLVGSGLFLSQLQVHNKWEDSINNQVWETTASITLTETSCEIYFAF